MGGQRKAAEVARRALPRLTSGRKRDATKRPQNMDSKREPDHRVGLPIDGSVARIFEKGVDAMIGLLLTILLSLSISLFAAHAYDAYRTR